MYVCLLLMTTVATIIVHTYGMLYDYFHRCCRRRWRRVLQLHLLLRLCECDYLLHRHLRRSRFLLFLWGRNRVAASNRPDVRRQSSWLLQTYLSSTLLKANPNPACLYDNIAAVMFVWKVYSDAGVLFSCLNNSISCVSLRTIVFLGQNAFQGTRPHYLIEWW